MLKNTIFAALLAVAASAAAQGTNPPVELEKRLRDLETKVQQIETRSGTSPDLSEVRRQIEALTIEIEGLKTGEKKAVQADLAQFGLGAAASKVYRSDAGVSIGGYGEFSYQNYRAAGAVDRADLLRGVLYTGYKFSDRALFNSELEVEHATTERGGAVSMEFAYLDYLVRPELNVRAGLVLLPLGLINEQHEPTSYLGARRPTVERVILPATWGEMGAGIFGDAGRLSYRAYVVTGLNSHDFGAAEGIREGRQAGAEAKANDLAWTGRLDWHPVEGTNLGGGLYSGNSGQDAGFGGCVTLAELHADAHFRGVSLRALVARGSIADAAAINAQNGLSGDGSVGRTFGGWYAEGGYDLASRMDLRGQSLAPYLRYERFDTQRSVPPGFARNPENDGSILTIGAAYKPVPQTVIKLDWQRAKNRAKTGDNQVNVALGYIF